MYRIIRRLFRRLPFLHRTLEQELHNPLQRDRLPDTRKIELEFPAVSGSLAENQKSTRRTLLVAFLIALTITSVGIGLGSLAGLILGSNIPSKLVMFTSAVGFAFVACAYLSARRPPWRGFLQWIVVPHVALALLLLDVPALAWTATAIFVVLVADRFATHYLHLQTTAPMDRTRALTLRKLWDGRCGLRRSVKGSELYALLLFLPPAAVLLLLWAEHRAPHEYDIDVLLRLGLCVIGIIVLTILIDWLAAFLFVRPAVHPRLMFRHLNRAIVQWVTYNRAQLSAPGIYQTPAGSYRQRWWMSLGLLLLTAAATALLAGPRVPPEDEPLQPTAMQQDEPTKAATEAVPDRENTQLADAPLVLEPYQERMVESMPAERRKEYLAQLRAARDAEQASADARALEPEDSAAPRAESVFDNAYGRTLEFIYFSASFFVTSTLAAILCLLFLYACLFATTGRLAGHFGPRTSVSPDELLTSERWKQLVARVQSSEDSTEKKSLLLGVNAKDNTPILVPRDVFAEHAHLLGDSGSGKTSIGIASILSQLIQCKECSVVVLDLKGDDMALFEGVHQDAKAAGLRFRWFTNQLERSTYAFNPLRQRPLQRMTRYQKVDMLTAAMGLQYGRDYGRAYYADANARRLYAVLEQYPQIQSFEHLAAILGDANSVRGVDRDLRQAGAHVEAIANRLADSEALNVVPDGGHPQSVVDAAIEFTDLFRKPEAVYFHLTSTIGTTSSAEIARIALYSLITAASAVPPKERKQTFVVIDEFQRIVAGNIEMLLQLARSLNIGIILANQSLMDLKTAGVDLIPAISANTRFRQIFAASNLEEQERIARGSGEALTFQQSWHEYIGGFTTLIDGRNLSENITPRLRINDILLATDHPLQSIVQIRRGAGYAQYGGMPFVMRSTHHLSWDDYQNRKDADWPEATEETLVPQINDRPRGRYHQFAQVHSENMFVDEPPPAASAGDFLNDMYQKQLWGSGDDSPSADSKQPDHSASKEKDHD